MSSSDEPASSGDEMRSFGMEGIVISCSIDGSVVEGLMIHKRLMM